MYFHYVAIIVPWKKIHDPSFEQFWIPFTLEYFISCLFEISRMVLEKKIVKSCQYIYFFAYISPYGNWIPITNGWSVPSWNWNWSDGSGEEVVNILSLCCYYLPVAKDMALQLNKLESSSHRNGLSQVWWNFTRWFWRS